MIVLADSNITKAEMSAFVPMQRDVERCQNYVLADVAEADGTMLDIGVNFNQGEIPTFDTIALCNHNIDIGETITIELSNIDFDIPDEVHYIEVGYGFISVLQLSAPVSYQYIRITAENAEDNAELGFIDIGVRTEFPDPLVFSRGNPTGSLPALNATRQPYGERRFNYDRQTLQFRRIEEEKVLEILSDVWDKAQNVIPVLWFVHEAGDVNRLNHPNFGIIEETDLNMKRRSRDGFYDFDITFGGTF